MRKIKAIKAWALVNRKTGLIAWAVSPSPYKSELKSMIAKRFKFKLPNCYVVSAVLISPIIKK